MITKHIIPKLFAAWTALCPAVTPLSAATFGNFTYTDDGTSITITDYPTSATGAVVIPATIAGKHVTSIGDSAFSYCSGLTSVTIPSSVKSISLDAFENCSGLTSVTIPSSVTSIEVDAFSHCGGLTAISVAPTNPNYSSIGGVLFNRARTSLLQYPAGTHGNYNIPSSVTSIEADAFQECSGLTSVTIPSSVTSIAGGAFEGCSVLTDISVAPTNTNYSSIGGVLFNKARSTLLQYPGGIHGNYNIPSSVTSIGISAFEDCSGLTSVTIPSSVTSIEMSAFRYCSGLTSVTIPSSVTRIEIDAFESCSGLTTAKFSGNAPTMDWGVFDYSAPGFKINYIKGKTGFTSPTWLGYPCVGVAAVPEIDVQQPVGTSLVDGTAKKSFGTVVVGQSGTAKTFTIKNAGTGNLSGLAVSKDGANAGNFLITPPAKTTLPPGTSTTFKVTFKPTASGTRTAAIHINSNDANENPFDIQLTGLGAP